MRRSEPAYGNEMPPVRRRGVEGRCPQRPTQAGGAPLSEGASAQAGAEGPAGSTAPPLQRTG